MFSETGNFQGSGEPLSNFFGSLQETVGLLAGTDHQISPYHHAPNYSTIYQKDMI